MPRVTGNGASKNQNRLQGDMNGNRIHQNIYVAAGIGIFWIPLPFRRGNVKTASTAASGRPIVGEDANVIKGYTR